MGKIECNDNSSRNLSLYFAKGIGMCLVVYAHFVYFEPLLTIIYSFHMPLFFVISGLLFNDNKYTSFIMFLKSKAKALLIPYVIFVIVSLFMTCAINLLSGIKFDFFQTILNLLIAKNSTVFASIHNEPLWFVPCLFLVECIYFFINKIKNPVIFILVVAFTFCLGWLLSNNEYLNIFPWNLRAALFSISFYSIGHRFIRRYYFGEAKVSISKILLLIVLFSSLAICVPLAMLNGKVSLGHNIVNNGLILFFTGILGTLFVLSFSELCYSIPFIVFIGKNSFLIMGIHMLVGSATHAILQKLFSLSNSQLSENIYLSIAFSIFVLLSSVALVYLYTIIKKKFHKK